MNQYDVLVIGAGHAGLEAAFACSKRKLKVGLITLSKNSIGLMPCNPSIGGPAKGIVTKEIDILGGMQAKAADDCQLQMKLLNTSKGPGVWALRAQIDKVAYHQWFVNQLEKSKIDLIIDEVKEVIVQNNEIKGVVCSSNIYAKYVIVTSGTYLDSLTFKGNDIKKEGPDGLKTTKSLSDCFRKLNINLIRLKTGTPARINKDSIDYSKLKIEGGTNLNLCFSHFDKKYLPLSKQLPCYIVYTNQAIHDLIEANLEKSAMYGGYINAIGPRYCPSIEDKVVKFNDKPRHQIFVEPESLHLNTMYLAGFSTSMPIDIQDKMIKLLTGFENAIIEKYAYAIEYDAIDPLQLKRTLELKSIKNLYFAGQINGTSGYEEAAAQGLIAAINVANNFHNMKELVLTREVAYIGVMIDDITTKGILEPYRLLTSRAEHRLYLRNDNADSRLIKLSYENKMIDKKQYTDFLSSQAKIDTFIDYLKKQTIGMYKKLSVNEKKTNLSLFDYLKRPNTKLNDLLNIIEYKHNFSDQEIQKIEIFVKFSGYILKQKNDIDKMQKLHLYKLVHIKDYKQVANLSLEAIDKLNKIMPYDLDQASRISGINISDILNIKFYLDKNSQK